MPKLEGKRRYQRDVFVGLRDLWCLVNNLVIPIFTLLIRYKFVSLFNPKKFLRGYLHPRALDGHLNVVLEVSALWRTLAQFEPDPERQVAQGPPTGWWRFEQA